MASDFTLARLNMVESQIRTADVTDLPLQDALRVAPRDVVVPSDRAHLAYADAEVEYAPGRWLLRPRDIGKLLQALKPRAGEKALAIAAPYGTQVLRVAGLTVDEIGAEQTPARAAYEVIVVEGAVNAVPDSWTAALADGGRLAVIVRDGPMGKARLYTKTDGRVVSYEAFDAAAAYLPGHEPKAAFAF